MPFQNLYHSIFEPTNPAQDEVEMLERQVKLYPYFTVAHFFLLKYSRQGHPGYAGVAAKTAMHFNHPFYLHAQLNKVADAQVSTDNAFATVFHTPESFSDEMLSVTDNNIEDAVYPEEEINEADYGETPPVIAAKEAEENLVEDPTPVETGREIENAQPADNEEPDGQQESVMAGQEVSDEGLDVAEGAEQAVLPQSTPLEPVHTVEVESVPEPAPIAPPAAKVDKEAPLFEPLFATDYFASQGIKLREEVLANDKLGKQLRSFTDWLKTMKKVHEGKLPAGSETLDLSVQKLAEKSNKEEEVITETMAEVYLQQGKQQKAREIYEKLSLLNPSKMAYFAAKIDQIQ